MEQAECAGAGAGLGEEPLSTPPCEPPILQLPPVKRISLTRQLRSSPFPRVVLEDEAGDGTPTGPPTRPPALPNGLGVPQPMSTPRASPAGTAWPCSPAQRLLFAGETESPPETPRLLWRRDGDGEDDDGEGSDDDSPMALYAKFAQLQTTCPVPAKKNKKMKTEQSVDKECLVLKPSS